MTIAMKNRDNVSFILSQLRFNDCQDMYFLMGINN